MSAQTANPTKSQSAKSVTSSGTKRKRGNEPKFYAVKVGMKPGIYSTWPDCYQQINGYKHALFKAFTSLGEAEAFLGIGKPGVVTKSSNAPQKFYAVQNGRVPGVYGDWPSAQKQIVGWTKPRFKAFPTRAEAEAFVQAGGDNSSGSKVLSGAQKESEKPGTGKRSTKKQKVTSATEVLREEDYEPGTGPLPEDAEDGFDNRIFLNAETGEIEYKSEAQRNATRLQATSAFKGEFLRIYTDGSSLGNGKQGAFAGVGVYFGPCDDRNLSEPLDGPRQTNQRAELTAIQRALGLSPLDRNVEIFTDSSYSIKCVTEWIHNWRRNGWQTSARKPVENRDLIEAIKNKIEERDEMGVQTKLVWVKGHSNDEGNITADSLAVKGASNSKAMANGGSC